MTVFRSIRVHMADRPGALSAITAALAAHGVDIVRLDVVSHEGETVVDDLYLSADDEEAIYRATHSFYGDVAVRGFESAGGDIPNAMATALAAIAAARSPVEAAGLTAAGALTVVNGDEALLLRCSSSGGLSAIAGPAPSIAPTEAFAGRWSLEHESALAVAATSGWAPDAFKAFFGAWWVAMAPLGKRDVLVLARRLDMPFYAGELHRLLAYASAAHAIRSLTDPAAVTDPPASDWILPSGALVYPTVSAQRETASD